MYPAPTSVIWLLYKLREKAQSENVMRPDVILMSPVLKAEYVPSGLKEERKGTWGPEFGALGPHRLGSEPLCHSPAL